MFPFELNAILREVTQYAVFLAGLTLMSLGNLLALDNNSDVSIVTSLFVIVLLEQFNCVGYLVSSFVIGSASDDKGSVAQY